MMESNSKELKTTLDVVPTSSGAQQVVSVMPMPSLSQCSLGISPKEPPDVAFDRLCKVHQTSGNQQLCQVCQRIFPNWYKLKQHLHAHADFRPYTCAYCEKTFRNYSKKSRHEKTHSGLKPYVCKICNKHVSRSEHLKRHLLTHTESHPYKCIHCEYRSRRLDCIRYHMKNKHPEIHVPKIMFNQQLVDANDDHPNDASDLLWQQYKDSPTQGILLPPPLQPDPPSEPKPKKKKKKKSTESNAVNLNVFQDGKMPVYPVSCAASVLSTSQLSSPQFPTPMPLVSSPSMLPGFSGFQALNHQANTTCVKPQSPAYSNPPGTPTNNNPGTNSHNHASPSNQQKTLDSSFSEEEVGSPQSKYFLSPGLQQQQGSLDVPKNMCTVCEKSFDCPSKLQRHHNTHAGIRPFKCHVCGKQLSRPEHLKRHLTTHNPEKSPSKPANWKSKSSKTKTSQAAAVAAAAAAIASSVSAAVVSTPTAAENLVTQGSAILVSPSHPPVTQSEKNHQHNKRVEGDVKLENESNRRTDCQLQKPTASASSLITNSLVKAEYSQALNSQSINPAVATAWNQVTMSAPTLSNPGIPMAMVANAAMRPVDMSPQLAGSNALGSYGPHVAMLHSYAAFGAAAQNVAAPAANFYNHRAGNPALGAPNMVMQNTGAGCSLPVFPPITEMR